MSSNGGVAPVCLCCDCPLASQRLNRKALGTGCCEWLWSIVTWANEMLPRRDSIATFIFQGAFPSKLTYMSVLDETH